MIPGVDPELVIGSWTTWETGIPPSFVLEVVSDDVKKGQRGRAGAGLLEVEELGAQAR